MTHLQMFEDVPTCPQAFFAQANHPQFPPLSFPEPFHSSLEKLHLVVIDVIVTHGTENSHKVLTEGECGGTVSACQLSFLQTEIASWGQNEGPDFISCEVPLLLSISFKCTGT